MTGDLGRRGERITEVGQLAVSERDPRPPERQEDPRPMFIPWRRKSRSSRGWVRGMATDGRRSGSPPAAAASTGISGGPTAGVPHRRPSAHRARGGTPSGTLAEAIGHPREGGTGPRPAPGPPVHAVGTRPTSLPFLGDVAPHSTPGTEGQDGQAQLDPRGGADQRLGVDRPDGRSCQAHSMPGFKGSSRQHRARRFAAAPSGAGGSLGRDFTDAPPGGGPPAAAPSRAGGHAAHDGAEILAGCIGGPDPVGDVVVDDPGQKVCRRVRRPQGCLAEEHLGVGHREQVLARRSSVAAANSGHRAALGEHRRRDGAGGHLPRWR